jgi:hypothetical protein
MRKEKLEDTKQEKSAPLFLSFSVSLMLLDENKWRRKSEEIGGKEKNETFNCQCFKKLTAVLILSVIYINDNSAFLSSI